MLIESIILGIFICSFGGILLILIRKAPVLVTLPQNGTTGIKKHRLISDVENKIKGIFLFFEKQILLHKLLSWVKVMTLRVETRIDTLLHRIRKKAQKIDQELKEKK
jgi:hypothetical protein